MRYDLSFSRDDTTCDYGLQLAFRIIFVGEIGTRAIKFRNIDGRPVRKRDNWPGDGNGRKVCSPASRTGTTFHLLLYQAVPRDYRGTGSVFEFRAWVVINCRGKNSSALAFFEFRPNFRAGGDKRQRNLWPPTRKVPRGIRDGWSADEYNDATLTAIQSRSAIIRTTLDDPICIAQLSIIRPRIYWSLCGE